MKGSWGNITQSKSVSLLQRIRSYHPVKKRTVLPAARMDFTRIADSSHSFDYYPNSLNTANVRASQDLGRSQAHWDRHPESERRNNANVPLVIRNPVHSRKLEEPIERKREYWSDNLLYIMRSEGLIPKDCEAIMDRPTPEEPYRLSANVVRLLEQEPTLYMAKSNIKLPNFPHLNNAAVGANGKQPGVYFDTDEELLDIPISFDESSNSTLRPSHKCCGCGRNSVSNYPFANSRDHKSNPFFRSSGGQSYWPSFEQARGYSTTAARNPQAQSLEKRLPVVWDPLNYAPVHDKYIGSDEISIAIMKLWEKKRQKKRTYENKLKMKKYLEAHMFSEYRISMTGSSANGFGFDNSDVDLCLQLKNNFLSVDHNSELLLRSLKGQMAGVDCFKRPIVISAVCPLLSFTYKRMNQSPIKVDLNIGNKVGIVNTQLLYAYSRMDGRVAPLVGACKHWASTMNIKKAQEGLLASYALTLLILYYLQNAKVVPVLHSLMPELTSGKVFGSDREMLLPQWSSPNGQNLGSLFRDLLEFYAQFDFEQNCVSVRDGALLTLDEARAQDPDVKYKSRSSRQWWTYINVQEPFNFTNTARSVFTKTCFNEIKNTFKQSYNVIQHKGGVQVLFGTTNPDLNKGKNH